MRSTPKRCSTAPGGVRKLKRPSTTSVDGFTKVSSTSVTAKSWSIDTRTSRRCTTSEKRGLPLSPGGLAPTVPMPNGAGSLAASAVARPPVQSSQATSGARAEVPSTAIESRSPGPARTAVPTRADPRSTYTSASPPARTSTLARASDSSTCPCGVSTTAGGPSLVSTNARPCAISIEAAWRRSLAGPATSSTAPPSRRSHARPPAASVTASPSAMRSRG